MFCKNDVKIAHDKAQVTVSRGYLVNAVGLNGRIDQFLHKFSFEILDKYHFSPTPQKKDRIKTVGLTSRKNFLAPTLRALSLAAS